MESLRRGGAAPRRPDRLPGVVGGGGWRECNADELQLRQRLEQVLTGRPALYSQVWREGERVSSPVIQTKCRRAGGCRQCLPVALRASSAQTSATAASRSLLVVFSIAPVYQIRRRRPFAERQQSPYKKRWRLLTVDKVQPCFLCVVVARTDSVLSI